MDEQLRPGTVITTQAQISYRVVSLLGAGGQGEVYDVEAGGQHKARVRQYSAASLKSRGSFQFSRPRLSAAAR